jgi:hypothetical protein
MCELNLTEKARNVEHENDCCSWVYTAIGPVIGENNFSTHVLMLTKLFVVH